MTAWWNSGRTKVGNGNHTMQSTVSSQASYDQTAFGGRDGISFDHVDDYFNINHSVSSAGLNMFVVISTDITDTSSNYSGSPGMSIIGDTSNRVYRGFGVHGDDVDYRQYSSGWN